MKPSRTYYLSRTILAALFGLLLYLSGAPLWGVILGALLAAAWFAYAPRSGRYTVDAARDLTPLGRDERGQIVNDKAARNAFVVLALLTAGITLYAGEASVPAQWLSWALLIAVVTYAVSDFAFRRS
ncbi:MAG TPA: hypothetical protein ENL35_06855 [Chloroflexi bacterium]|nr:hypothetical protein [Chloroflexota bacterium]